MIMATVTAKGQFVIPLKNPPEAENKKRDKNVHSEKRGPDNPSAINW